MKVFQEIDHREDQDQPLTWFTKKKLTYILCGALVCTGLAGVGYSNFREYRKKRLTANAQDFYEKKDFRAAGMLLEQLVAEDPRNFVAQRLLARILDGVSPQQGFYAWENLTKTDPAESANLIGYAYAALRLGLNEKLSAALAKLAEYPPTTLEYQRLLAACALTKGDRVNLQSALTELARLEPTNELTQLNLATLMIGSLDPAEVMTARVKLQNIAAGNSFRIRATLALIQDAPRRWPELSLGRSPYTQLAEELGLPQSKTTSPGTAHFMLAPLDRDRNLPALIVHMQEKPGSNLEDWATLAMWMNLMGQPREALIWLESLADTQAQSSTVLAARATLTAQLALWPKLEQLLHRQAWGEISPESVRLAFEARTNRESGDKFKADRAWDGAVREAEYSLSSLRIFYRLTQRWGWSDQRIQILWVMARRFPGYGPSWQRLLEHALSTHDSPQVLRIYAAWSQALPDDISVQSERVLIGLLIQPANQKLITEAEDLFRKNPDNPSCRIAQALGLWRNNQTSQAWEILAPLKLDPAQEPRFALVKGLILAANHLRLESERLLRLVPTDQLLPEELALLKAAQTGY